MSNRRFWLVAICIVVLFGSIGVAVFTSLPVQAQGQTGSNWLGFYWNNTDFSGSPTYSRIDPAINFNWGTASPVPGVINTTNFSIRWSTRQAFSAGTYRFRAGADDGIRVAVNGQVIINRFTESAEFVVNTADVVLGAGDYEIIVDYFRGASGNAGVLFDWTLATAGGGGTGVVPAPTGAHAVPTSTAVPALRGVVLVDLANVRSGPGLEYPTIAQVRRDAVLTIRARNGEYGFETWFLVDLGGDARGWIARRVLFPYGDDEAIVALPFSHETVDAPPLAASSTITGVTGAASAAVSPLEVRGVARANAMLRDAPSVRFGNPIGVINLGESFQILRLSTDQAWVFVDFGGLQGWTFVLNVRVTLGRLSVLPRSDE